MHDTARPQPLADRSMRRDMLAALAELRRMGREALSDLGLTDEEIAAYYGENPSGLQPAEPVSLQ